MLRVLVPVLSKLRLLARGIWIREDKDVYTLLEIVGDAEFGLGRPLKDADTELEDGARFLVENTMTEEL